MLIVKLTKKLTVLVLAFLMIFAISACNGLKVVKELASVNGRAISEGEFKYYLENVKQQMLTEAGLSSEEEIESFWSGDIDGENAEDVARNMPPAATYFSRWKATAPSPPRPPQTVIRTLSTNINKPP